MSPTGFLARVLPFAVAGSAAAASLHKSSFARRAGHIDIPVPGRMANAVRRQEQVATSTAMNFTNVADPFNFNTVNLYGDNQVIYTANVTVDGQSYEVQLDTGSSDFWLNTQNHTLSSQAIDTNISATITYGDMNAATGDIFLADTQFGNFTIPSQAFINAPGSNATSDNDLGLLGLSSANLSQVAKTLQNTSFNGKPPMYNIFSTYTNVSTYMTFLLARSDLGITDGGIFTIGDVDPNWSAVLNQTKVPVIQTGADQQWAALVDGMIVDGKNYSGHGILSKQKGVSKDVKDKTVAVFDSGTSLAYIPQYYWDAIYKSIPGIQTLSKSQNLYSFPCDTKLNVSFVINGTEYPMNPIDITRVTSLASNFANINDTAAICVNAFQPGDLGVGNVDMILGDTFLRNAYTLFNFGNWTTPGSPGPYLQLLPTTNQADAWAQFDSVNNARIQQWNELGGQFNISSASDASTTSSAVAVRRRAVPARRAEDYSLPSVHIGEAAMLTYHGR